MEDEDEEEQDDTRADEESRAEAAETGATGGDRGDFCGELDVKFSEQRRRGEYSTEVCDGRHGCKDWGGRGREGAHKAGRSESDRIIRIRIRIRIRQESCGDSEIRPKSDPDISKYKEM